MAKRQLVAVGVMCTALAAASAGAQSAAPAHPSPPKAEKAGGGGEKRADKAEAKAAKAEAKGDAKGDRPDGKPDRDKPGGKPDKAEAKDDKGEHGGRDDKGHGGPDHGHFRGGLHGLFRDFKDGKVKKEELKDLLAKLHDSADQRRNEHRQELKGRWGSVLMLPPAREELRHHARRMAFLNRALFLAQTEASPKDKDKLVERIEKIIDKENERHDRAMERLKSMPPGPAPAISAAALTAPAASAAAAAKGAEK